MQETSPRMASGRWSHKICRIKDTEVLSDRCTCFKPAHGHSITSDPQKPLQHKRSSHDVQIIRARKQKYMRSSTSPADKRHTRPCRRNPERPMVPNQRSQHLPATSACPTKWKKDNGNPSTHQRDGPQQVLIRCFGGVETVYICIARSRLDCKVFCLYLHCMRWIWQFYKLVDS
jgi:hypothetical protein